MKAYRRYEREVKDLMNQNNAIEETENIKKLQSEIFRIINGLLQGILFDGDNEYLYELFISFLKKIENSKDSISVSFPIATAAEHENYWKFVHIFFEAIGYNERSYFFLVGKTHAVITVLLNSFMSTYSEQHEISEEQSSVLYCVREIYSCMYVINANYEYSKKLVNEESFNKIDLDKYSDVRYIYDNFILINSFVSRLLDVISEQTRESLSDQQEEASAQPNEIKSSEIQIQKYEKPNFPTKYIYPKGKINSEKSGIWGSSELANDLLNGKTLPVKYTDKIEKDGTKEPICSYIKADYSNLPEFIEKKLTPFDKDVYNAISNFQHIGNSYITFNQLGEYVYHTKKINGKRKNELKKSILKLDSIIISLDNAEYASLGKGKIRFSYTGNLLNVNIVKLQKGKLEIEVIGFNPVNICGTVYNESPLFLFDLLNKHVKELKVDSMYIPMSYTLRNREIRHYLFDNVFQSKYYKDGKITIYFDNLLESIGVKRSDYKQSKSYRDELKKIQETVITILDHWVLSREIESHSNFVKSETSKSGTSNKITQKKVIIYFKKG